MMLTRFPQLADIGRQLRGYPPARSYCGRCRQAMPRDFAGECVDCRAAAEGEALWRAERFAYRDGPQRRPSRRRQQCAPPPKRLTFDEMADIDPLTLQAVLAALTFRQFRIYGMVFVEGLSMSAAAWRVGRKKAAVCRMVKRIGDTFEAFGQPRPRSPKKSPHVRP